MNASTVYENKRFIREVVALATPIRMRNTKFHERQLTAGRSISFLYLLKNDLT
jgi:hypothetical protein